MEGGITCARLVLPKKGLGSVDEVMGFVWGPKWCYNKEMRGWGLGGDHNNEWNVVGTMWDYTHHYH